MDSSRSVTLCVSMFRSTDTSKSDVGQARRDETLYHDTGEISGWQSFYEVPPPKTDPVLTARGVFGRLTSERLDVRVELDPEAIRGLFESHEFDAWNESVQSILQAAAGSDIKGDWKASSASVLVIEDARMLHLPTELPQRSEYVREWLGSFNQDQTVAHPSQVGETILISPPHLMALKSSTRAVCALVRPRPDTVRVQDLALPRNVLLLLDCWFEAIRIEALLRQLQADPFHKRSLKEYLDHLGWYRSRRRRLAQYEAQFLPDREGSMELVSHARDVLAEADGRLRFNPWRRLPETSTTLLVGKRSQMEYPVAATVMSTIETPFRTIDSAIQRIETRRAGVSDHLRDAASVHTERTNWIMQWAVIALTVVTILSGTASLTLDWLGYELALNSASRRETAPIESGRVSDDLPTQFRVNALSQPPVDAAAAAPCAPEPTPTRAPFRDVGGTGLFRVEANESCEWSVASDVEWVVVNTDRRFGSGEVEYRVRANEEPRSRSGSIRVNGRSHFVTQDAPPLLPPSQ